MASDARGCTACGRFAFPAPTVCWWCRDMTAHKKHRTLETYDRAYTAVVRARRRHGFPAWCTVEEADVGLETRTDDGVTWRTYLESRQRGSAAHLRNNIYIVNQVHGRIPWQHAHAVPALKADKHGDPVVNEIVRAALDGSIGAPPKKLLRKKAPKKKLRRK